MEAVERVVLLDSRGPQEAHRGFGWAAGEHNIIFYADNGHIAGQNPIWVQTTTTEMVRIFESVGLQKNIGKTKAMVCNLGFIWVQHGTAAYKRRGMGEGDTFIKQKKTG